MLTDKEQEEIRRKLLGLEEEPPKDGWKKISSQIQPARPPRSIWWLFPVILLLLLTGIGLYYLSDRGVEPFKTAQSEADKKIESSQPPEISTNSAIRKQTMPATENAQGESAPSLPEPENKVRDEGMAKTPETRPGRSNKLGSNNLPGQLESESKKKTTLASVKREKDLQTGGNSESRLAADSAQQTNVSITDLLEQTIPQIKESPAFVIPDSMGLAGVPDSSFAASTKLPDPASAQESGKWFIGVSVSPRYAFRSFKPAPTDEVYITKFNNRKNIDPERLGYELGLSAGKSIKPNLYLETSLTLTQLSENVSYTYTTGKVDTLLKTLLSDGSIHVKPVYVTGDRQLKSTFTYGGLRVGMTYFFLDRHQSRFNLTVAGGANLLVKGRTEEYFNGEYLKTVSFPSKDNLLEQTNYNLVLGIGYNVSVYNRYELMVMPSLNYFLGSSFAKREPFGLKPYSMGINFQVRRRLGS